jgi:hypothetical protein
MEKKLNQPLEVGDTIICYFMEGESGVTPGTKGVVTNIIKDPFDKNQQIIYVDWENGSKLSLCSGVDVWKKIPNQIKESSDMNNLVERQDIIKYFDWRFLKNFLGKLRRSGIVNMFGSSPLLYAGSEHIERYYGEGREDDESFLDMIEDADEAKYKMIQGTINYMKSKNMDYNDLDLVNSTIRRCAKDMLVIYVSLTQITGNP